MDSKEERPLSGSTMKVVTETITTTTTHNTMNEKSVESITDAGEEYNSKGERIYVQSDAEKALVRKLDFFYVMPFIAALNFLQVCVLALFLFFFFPAPSVTRSIFSPFYPSSFLTSRP